jgi:hypothetical protein
MGSAISVSVTRSFDEMIQAIAIRSAVYVGENGWSFSEDWDGNDFTCTHMIARVAGEPAGSLRLRYFGDFVKAERLAVLAQFRTKRYGGRGVAFELCDAGIEFCRRKGYTKFYGHSLEELVPFWSKIGRGMMRPLTDEIFDCNGKKVVPMAGDLPRTDDSLSLASGHMVLVRPEGEWDQPGFWELQGPPAPDAKS